MEAYLRSKGAITVEFGSLAYINTEVMPALLLDFVTHSAVCDCSEGLRAEIDRLGAEKQKIIQDNAQNALQLQSCNAELSSLKEQMAVTVKTIESFRAENLRLQKAVQTPLQVSPAASDIALMHAHEKLLKELQTLRSQSAEAIASLKVLEDENEEIREELEMLRDQAKKAAAPRVG